MKSKQDVISVKRNINLLTTNQPWPATWTPVWFCFSTMSVLFFLVSREEGMTHLQPRGPLMFDICESSASFHEMTVSTFGLCLKTTISSSLLSGKQQQPSSLLLHKP